MTNTIIFLHFLSLTLCWMAYIPDFSNYQYTLGTNLVVNGDFELPHASGSWMPAHSIPAWKCTNYF